MKYIKSGETAAILGVTSTTLRNWDKSGEFKPDRRTASGTRMYRQCTVEDKLSSMRGTPAKHFNNRIQDIMLLIDDLRQSKYYKDNIKDG